MWSFLQQRSFYAAIEGGGIHNRGEWMLAGDACLSAKEGKVGVQARPRTQGVARCAHHKHQRLPTDGDLLAAFTSINA